MRVVFIGSKRFGLRVLEAMQAVSAASVSGIVTCDDSDDSRSALTDFKAFAKCHRIPLFCPENKKHSEEIISKLEPTLCIVVGWYWLISPELIKSVPRGFIGIHNSLLPEFRGGSPMVWQVIAGHKQIGCSLFSFATGIDDGPIWAQVAVEIGEDDCIAQIAERIEDSGVAMFRDAYPRILDGTLEPKEQEHSRATYCAQRFPTDGNIDWHKPAREIYDLIRALSSPFPGAFTYLEGSTLKIWKARLFEGTYYGTPGQVARIAHEGVYVIAGDHRALILEVAEVRGVTAAAQQFFVSFRQRLSADPGTSIRERTIA